MSCRHHRGMVLVMKGGRTEVDQTNFSIQQDSSLAGGSIVERRRRRNFAIIRECLVIIMTEKNILRFQISVDKIEVVKNC